MDQITTTLEEYLRLNAINAFTTGEWLNLPEDSDFDDRVFEWFIWTEHLSYDQLTPEQLLEAQNVWDNSTSKNLGPQRRLEQRWLLRQFCVNIFKRFEDEMQQLYNDFRQNNWKGAESFFCLKV